MKENNKKKAIIWLSIFTFLIVVVTAVATYAITSIKQEYRGSFNVNVTSKGVDIFKFSKDQDVYFVADITNFARDYGHDIYGEGVISASLETTNEKTEYCYVMNIKLPDTKIFEYSQNGVPELVLDVSKSDDGKNYVPVIEKKDITTLTGVVKIPISKDSSVYKNHISTYRDNKVVQYWKARVTFVYLENVDQEINNNKFFKAIMQANVVAC